MDDGRRITNNPRKRVVFKLPIALFAAIFIFCSTLFALAASNISSIPNLSVTPPGISPQTADGFNDTLTISYSLSAQTYSNIGIYSDAISTVPVRNLLTNSSETAGNKAHVWDGRNDAGVLLPSKAGYKVRYNGISFNGVMTSGASLNPAQIDIDTSTNPYTIYLADNSAENRLFKSNDYGATWVKLGGTGLPAGAPITGVAVFNTGATPPDGYKVGDSGPGPNVTRIYAVAGTSRLYWSDNGGANFSNVNLKAGAVLQQLDTDAIGSVYMTNIDATPPHRVNKRFYDPGAPGWQFTGSTKGFYKPRGVAVVGTGTIYVSDSATSAFNLSEGRVWKSTDGGNTYSEIVFGGSGENQVGTEPYGVFHQASNDTIWVADPANNRVQQFWPNGDHIQTLKGTGSYNLSIPRAVAIGSDGNLFVGETGNTRVQKFIADNILGNTNIAIDNDAPESAGVAGISSPGGTGIYHKDLITFSAEAFDSLSGINKVEFYRDTDPAIPFAIDLDGGDGWSGTWDTSLLLNEGIHGIYIKAYDGSYNIKTSAAAPIVVDNTAPEAQITDPAAMSYKRALVQIVGTADDDNLENYTVEYDDGGWQELVTSNNAKDNETLATWNTIGKNGSYPVRVTVTDRAGNIASANVTFNVDNTVPDTVTTGNASNNPFSPVTSAGVKDTTTIALTANDNNGLDGTTSWSLLVKNLANATVRTYTGTGSPASQVWNGMYDDDLTPVPDGQYSYVYTVTDKAGNETSTAPKWVTVDNTGPSASIGAAGPSPFSPNADTVKDTSLLGLISSSDPSGITSWDIKIYDKDDLVTPVRTLSGAGDPNTTNQSWDGKDDLAAALPDDTYRYKLTVTDNAGNPTTTALNDVVLDNTAPVSSTSVATNDPFSPNADSVKDTTSVDLTSSDANGIASWELKFTDVDVKTFSGAGDPNGTTKLWGGDKDGGGNAANGTYTYNLTVTDNAGNQAISAPKTVIVDIVSPLATADPAVPAIFSPKLNGSVTTRINLTANDVAPQTLDPNNTSWSLVIKNASNIMVREYTGVVLPTFVDWNGKADDDPGTEPVPGGVYKYKYTVTDKAGNIGSSLDGTVTVDRTGPSVLIGNPSPSTFSPGISTTTIGQLTAVDTSGVTSWKVEFRLSGNPTVIKTISGVGAPDPETTTVEWDGRDEGGNFVADGVYEYIFKAYDSGDNEGATAAKTVTADSLPPVIADDSALPTHFSPNNDGINDNVTVEADISDISAISWKIEIFRVDGPGMYEFTTQKFGSGVLARFIWDGKLGGSKAPEGEYEYRISATDTASNESLVTTGDFYLDTVKPIASASLPSNPQFSPNSDGLKDSAAINISGNDSSPITSWDLQIETPSGVPVKLFSGTNETNSLADQVVWDGKDDLGITVSDGTYNYTLIVRDKAGNFFIAPQRSVIVDTTQPVIEPIGADPLFFAPAVTGNGYKTTAFNIDISDNLSSLNWQIQVKNSGSEIVRQFTGSGTENTDTSQVWDGKDGSSVIQPDGEYTIELTAIDTAGNSAVMQTSVVNLDSTRPVSSITSPLPSAKLYGDVSIRGTASDDNINTYQFHMGVGASPLDWDFIYGGNESKTPPDDELYNWPTQDNVAEDGNYTLRLTTKDKANNISVDTVIVSIENKLLQTSITSPANGDIINKTEPVIGIATNTNEGFFKNYRVEAQLKNAAVPTWQIVGTGSVPLVNATLTDWITNKYKDGEYTLRVLSFDKAGNVLEQRKNVFIDNTPPTYGIVSPANKTIASGENGEKIVITDVIDNISGLHETTPVELTVNDELVEAVYDPVEKTVTYEPDGGFEDGHYVATLNLMDKKENVLAKSFTWEFWVDNEIPQVAITEPGEGSTIGGYQPIIGTASDKHLTQWKLDYKLSTAPSWTAITPLSGYLATGKLSVSNGTISVWKTPAIAGLYSLRLTAIDMNGNQLSVVKNVIVDPNIQQEYVAERAAEITSPTSGFVKGAVTIKGKAWIKEGFQKYSIHTRKLPGKPTDITGAWSAAVFTSTAPVGSDTETGTLGVWPLAKNGTYQLQVRIFSTSSATPVLPEDLENDAHATVQVDNAAPPIPIAANTPINGGFTSNPRQAISANGVRDPYYPDYAYGSGIDNNTVEMRVDGKLVDATYNPVTSQVTHVPGEDLQDGRHIVTVRVKDRAGNSMLKIIKWSFTVDKGGVNAGITRPVYYPGTPNDPNDPEVYEKIKGTFAIRGIANAKNIKNYKIEAYMVNDPKSNTTPQWKTMFTSKTRVSKTATLFNWPTKVSGMYKIRLVVQDQTKQYVIGGPVYTKVQVDNNPPSIDVPFPAPKSVVRAPEGWDGVGVEVPFNDALDKFFRPGSGINHSKTILKLNDVMVPGILNEENNSIEYKPTAGMKFTDPETGAPGLADGFYNASLTVFDKVGNKATKNWSFTVDTTAPTASITVPSNQVTISNLQTQINGMAYDKNLSYYQLESKLSFEDIWKPVTSKIKFNVGDPSIPANGTLGVLALPPLEETYDLRVTAVDKAGNITVYPDPETPHQLKVLKGGTYAWGDSNEALTYPLDGMTFNGKTTPNLYITGSAKGPNFTSYQLIIDGVAKPAISTQVDNGNLGSQSLPLSISGLNKTMTVQLRVNRVATTAWESTPRTITVDSLPPLVKSFTPAAASFTSSPTQGISVKYTDIVGMNPDKFKVYIDGYLEWDIEPDGIGHNPWDNASYVVGPEPKTFTFNYSPDKPMSDGLHSIQVYAEDMGGFPITTPKSWTLTVDSNTELAPTLPQVSIGFPADNGYASGMISINGTAFDPSIASYKLEYTSDVVSPEPAWLPITTVLGKSVIDASLFKWDATKLTDGQYKIRLTMVDKAGNTLSTIRQFNLDNTAATAEISAPTLLTNIIKGNVDIFGSVSDLNFKNYKVEYLRSGTTNWNDIPVTAPLDPTQPKTGERLVTWNTSLVPDGSYTIKLTATNLANVSTAVTLAVKVDNIAPIARITTLTGSYAKGTFVINGQQTDGLNGNMSSRKVEVWPVGNPGAVTVISSGTTPLNNIGTIATWNTALKNTDLSPAFPDGAYIVSASAVDKAGNLSAVVTEGTDPSQILVTVDNTKPVAAISDPVANDFLAGTKALLGEIDDTNIDSYAIQAKLGTGTPKTVATVLGQNKIAGSTLASWITDDLNLDESRKYPDGNYTIILTATDKAGNITVQQVQVKVDNTKPTAAITLPLTGSTLDGVVTVTGSVNDTNILNWKLEYSFESGPWVAAQDGAGVDIAGITNKTPGTLGLWATDALASGEYRIRIVATDRAGNVKIAPDLTADPPDLPIILTKP